MNLFVNQSVQGKWLMPHLDHCWPFVVETQKKSCETHKAQRFTQTLEAEERNA